MITYFCYFGDTEVGEEFKKIIFGNTKLIPLFESKSKEIILPPSIHRMLIRYFVDGKISTYDQIEDSSFSFNKRAKEFLINHRLVSGESERMTLEETFKYIKYTTLDGIKLIEKELGSDIKIASVNEKIEEIFSKIYIDNVK